MFNLKPAVNAKIQRGFCRNRKEQAGVRQRLWSAAAGRRFVFRKFAGHRTRGGIQSSSAVRKGKLRQAAALHNNFCVSARFSGIALQKKQLPNPRASPVSHIAPSAVNA
jgi:hypothetical protein